MLLLFFGLSLFNYSKHIVEPVTSVYEISLKSIEGKDIDLESYRGKKILFVNVASECGFTPQYKGLQELHDLYKDKLVIIGLPCNQFGKQEPGSEKEIAMFCESNYGVEFLLTEKLDVKGENQHPIYSWLTDKDLNGKLNSGRPKPFSCKVEKVRRRKYFLLSKKLGSKKLLYMKHYFYLEEMENNGTRLTQKWEAQGILSKLFWKQISNGISAFKIMNEDLKKVSEGLKV